MLISRLGPLPATPVQVHPGCQMAWRRRGTVRSTKQIRRSSDCSVPDSLICRHVVSHVLGGRRYLVVALALVYDPQLAGGRNAGGNSRQDGLENDSAFSVGEAPKAG